MTIALTHPFKSRELDLAKIAAIKIEHNSPNGTVWIEYWVVVGYEDEDGNFHQQVDPNTGEEVYRHIKVENGCHPLLAGVALRKCPECGKWVASPECPDCGVVSAPYDGWSRLVALTVEGGQTILQAIRAVSYTFLLNEMVPDPNDWSKEIKLLDGTEV